MQASRDENSIPTLLGVSNVDGVTPVTIYADPVTHRLLVDNGGGGTALTVTDGVTTVTNVDTIDFASGATVTDGGGGVAEISVTGGTGTVDTVVGTTDRITVNSSDPANPVVDISANYVGQSSITTLGTITTGVWNGTDIAVTAGGTGVGSISALSIWVANSANTITEVTPTAGQSIRINGAGNAWEAYTPASGTVTSVSGTSNRITSTGGATPVIDIAGTYVGQTSITTLGTVTTGTWNGTDIALADGGTGASLTDPGADRILFWDDSAGAVTWLTVGTGLTITDTTISASGGSGANTALSNLASVAINTSLISDTDNTDALGSASIGWSDLFLGSGGVINWANGTLTLTQSGNELTVAGTGATFVAPTFVANTSFIPDSNDGASLGTSGSGFSDLFLAEGGVINWDSGDLTLTQSGNSLTLAGGDLVLSENTSVQLDPSLSADGTYSGITITGTAGTTLAFGDLIYLAAADSRWELVDADSVTTCGAVLTGMCVLAAAGDGSATTILLQGNIRADAAFPTLTVGANVYASTTAGDVTVTAPSATDDVVHVVGKALTADSMYFNPSMDYITIV